MHIDSKARPSRNVAEPGRDKRVPPGTPGTSQSPDATSASLPERPERRRARTRQARPSRIAAEQQSVTLFGRDGLVPSAIAHMARHFDGHGSLRRLLHMPRGMATLRQDPEETKRRGLRRAPCLAFSGITRNAVAYLVSAAFMNLAVLAITVMTALPSANARFEAL